MILRSKNRRCIYRIKHPFVYELNNLKLQAIINQQIIHKFTEDLDEIETCGNLREDTFKADIDYRITLNKFGLISIHFDGYGIWKPFYSAHGQKITGAITIDLSTGKEIMYRDLFNQENSFSLVMGRKIVKALRSEIGTESNYESKEYFDDKTLEADAIRVVKDCDFYLTRRYLVLINIYDNYALGYTKAPIIIKGLSKIANREGVLMRLIH